MRKKEAIYACRLVDKNDPSKYEYGVVGEKNGKTRILERCGNSYAVARAWAKRYNGSETQTKPNQP